MAQAKTAIAAPTSRRNFIRSSAAALAVASASPALALVNGGQDAELVELGRQHEIIDIQYREASETSTRIHRAMENQYPALPEVRKARETDKRFNLPSANSERFAHPDVASSKAGYYTTFHLNELKQFRLYQRKEAPMKESRREMFGPDAPPIP